MSATERATTERPGGVVLRITPLALLGGRHAARVLERNILVYRRSWIFLVSGFFEPLFYLLSIGVGLSHLVGPIPVDGRLVVSHTDRGDVVRIISVRQATRRERKDYEDGNFP